MRAQAHYLPVHTVPELWQSLSWHSYFISVQADCLPMPDSIMTQLFIKMRAVVCPWWTRSWNSLASTRKQIVCHRQTPSWHSLLSAWGQIACPWQTDSWHMPVVFLNTANRCQLRIHIISFLVVGPTFGFEPWLTRILYLTLTDLSLQVSCFYQHQGSVSNTRLHLHR